MMFLLPAHGCCLLFLGKAKELGFVAKSLLCLSSGCFVFLPNRHSKPMKVAKQFEVLVGLGLCVAASCWPRQLNALHLPREVLQGVLGTVLACSAQSLKLMHERR